MKTNFGNYKLLEYFYISLIFLSSVFFNQYFANIGVFPIDTFLFFDSGYKFNAGQFGLKDFWASTGLIVDIIQAFFFKVFGVSWLSYVLHASFFNFLISISLFYTLKKLELEINYCFFYSITLSLVAYTNSGTPFLDHHSMIFSLIAIFFLIIGIKENKNIYWFFIPIFLFFGFLSKQTPTAYIILLIAFLTMFYLILNFSYKKITTIFFSILLCILFFLLFLYINEIKIMAFVEQYIIFPSTIGEKRIPDYLYPLEFKRYFLKYKIIHLSSLLMIVVIFKNAFKNIKYLKSNEFIILFSLIACGYIFIFHQMLSLNQKFTFMIIPILISFSHICYKKYFVKKKIILYFLLLLATGSTFYNITEYANTRKFMDLEEVDLKKSVNAKILSQKLNGLRWISKYYPNNPEDELNLINDTIKIIKKDFNNKMLITHYQFIASIIDDNKIFSPARTFTTDGVGYPMPDNKLFEEYKNFFNNQIQRNEIKTIYLINPIKDIVVTDFLDEKCFKREKINNFLTTFKILNCY
jgi:hypothetical protein